MSVRSTRLSALATTMLVLMPACASAPQRGLDPRPLEPDSPLGQVYASTDYQLTGVAVSAPGRIFVSFPRWGGPYRMAVGEIGPGNTIKPYPNAEWNRFNAEDPANPPSGDHFVCVQSVHVDARSRLWILDPAAPNLDKVIRAGGGGPKLVQVDMTTNAVARVIRFDPQIAPERSYLNDVRVEISPQGDTAYITDSGLGALVVVDLTTGEPRRVLADHPSTKADPYYRPVIGGRELKGKDGRSPQVHSDGIALDSTRGWLYWQALTGARLFRAPTRLLKDPRVSEADLEASVEDLGPTVMADGLECDADGVVYLTALEKDAIITRSPDGRLNTITSDKAIAWPDTMAFCMGRMPGSSRSEPLLCFTTSQIHRTAAFSPDGSSPSEPYRVLVVPLSGR